MYAFILILVIIISNFYYSIFWPFGAFRLPKPVHFVLVEYNVPKFPKKNLGALISPDMIGF